MAGRESAHRGDVEGCDAAGQAEPEKALGELVESGPVDFDGGRREAFARTRPLPEEVVPENLWPRERWASIAGGMALRNDLDSAWGGAA